MVGHWPGHEEGAGKSWADMGQVIARQEWPGLEKKYLGEVISKCWTGDYESSQSLRLDLLEFLRVEGWQVEAGDDLQFDLAFLSDEKCCTLRPSLSHNKETKGQIKGKS